MIMLLNYVKFISKKAPFLVLIFGLSFFHAFKALKQKVEEIVKYLEIST